MVAENFLKDLDYVWRVKWGLNEEKLGLIEGVEVPDSEKIINTYKVHLKDDSGNILMKGLVNFSGDPIQVKAHGMSGDLQEKGKAAIEAVKKFKDEP